MVMTMSKTRQGRKISTEMGMRRMLSPLLFVGTGTENFSPYGDGDGEAFPDGEFFIASTWQFSSI